MSLDLHKILSQIVTKFYLKNNSICNLLWRLVQSFYPMILEVIVREILALLIYYEEKSCKLYNVNVDESIFRDHGVNPKYFRSIQLEEIEND